MKLRERISPEEGKQLEQRARHKELVQALTRLDNNALQSQLVELMTKAVERLAALQGSIDTLKAKVGEPAVVQPQVTVDNSSIAEVLERSLAAMEAKMQHELARLTAKEQAQEMHIEFTRSETGYIQSPIIVRPA